VFSFLATLALLRYGFLEPKLTLHKGIAASITGIATTAIAAVIAFALNQTFLEDISLPFILLVLVILSLAFVPIARPAASKLQSMLGGLFYGTRYGYLEALEGFNRETRNIDDLDGLASHLIRMIADGMQSKSVYLLLTDSQTGRLVTQSCYERYGEADAAEISFSTYGLIAQTMKFENNLIDVQEMDVYPSLRAISDRKTQALARKGIDLLVPLKVGGRLTGMLLVGGKINSRPFSTYERRLLEIISRQGSLAIENARLFSEEKAQRKRVEEFNAERVTFLDALAHEMKTPLTSALSSSELLVNELRNHSESLRLLSEDVWTAVKGLERIVGDILDFGRTQNARLKLSMERIDLCQLGLAMKDEFAARLRVKNQGLSVTLSDTPIWVRADSERLKQVLRNLIDNAAKFSPHGTNICLRINMIDRSAQIQVEDSAEPIGAQDQRYLFTAYYRGEKAQGKRVPGLGLGLFISKQIVELHGGKIWLAKNEERGNIFCIMLPSE
jgi:signal transduction histidine kinase